MSTGALLFKLFRHKAWADDELLACVVLGSCKHSAGCAGGSPMSRVVACAAGSAVSARAEGTSFHDANAIDVGASTLTALEHFLGVVRRTPHAAQA